MRQFFWTLCCVFIVNIGFVFAQNRVHGIVTNASEMPLSGAHIHLNQLATYTQTDGSFAFDDVTSQSYHLKISHIGFEPFDTLFFVKTAVFLKIKLVPKVISFATVNVFAKNKVSEKTEVSIKNEALQRLKHLNFGEMLQEINGVSALRTGQNLVKPIVNGLHSSRVVMVQNGLKQEDQQWGADHAPAISSNSMNEVSLVQGVKTLHYAGDALGGLLLSKPFRTPLQDTIFGSQTSTLQSNGRGGVLNASVFIGKEKGWYGNVQTTYKKLGDLNTPDYILSNTGSEEQHFALNFGKRNSQKGFGLQYSFFNANIGILRAAHIGNISDLVKAINLGEPQYIEEFTTHIASPRQESTHHFLSADYFYWFDNRHKISIDYGFQLNNRKEFDIRRTNRNRPAIDMQLASHALQTTFEYAKSTENHFFVGFTGLYQNNFSDTENTGVRALIPNYNKFDAGFFLTNERLLTEKVSLETGIRYDYSQVLATKFYEKSRWSMMQYDADFAHFIVGDFGFQWKTAPEFTFQNVSFSSELHWKMNAQTQADFSVSVYNRNPNPAELFSDGLHHSTGQVELGDLRLKKEQGVKINAFLRRKFQKGNLSVQPYLQRIQNFMVLEPIGIETNIRGAFPVWQYHATDVLMQGFDVDFDYSFHQQWNFSTALAVVYAHDLSENRPLQNMPPARWKQNLLWKSNGVLPWEIALNHQIVFTQKRFPNNDFEVLVPENGDLIPTNVAISRPPSGYQWTSFSVRKSWKNHLFFKENGTIDTGIVVQNFFNTQFRDYLNSMRFYADDMGRNILIQIQFNF